MLPFVSVTEVSQTGASVGACERMVLYPYLFFALLAWAAAWLAGWRLGGRLRWSVACLAAWGLIRLAAGLDYPVGRMWVARATYAWIEPDKGLLEAVSPANASEEVRAALQAAAMRDALAACHAARPA